MKILITGATGMLGSDICRALKDDFELMGISRKSHQDYLIPITSCDLTQIKQITSVIEAFSPDLVFHCAAYTHVDLCETNQEEAYAGNVVATENLASVCSQGNIPIAMMSTDYVFDGTLNREYNEDDVVNPLNYYGKTKQLAEESLAKNCTHYSIFRLSWLYGIRGKSFPRTILELSHKQQTFSVVDDQWGRPTWTWDIAIAFKLLLKNNLREFLSVKGDVFHLGSAGSTHWAGLAEKILFTRDCTKYEVQPINSGQLNRPAKRPSYSVLSLEKVKNRFNLSLRRWDEALEACLKELDGE